MSFVSGYNPLDLNSAARNLNAIVTNVAKEVSEAIQRIFGKIEAAIKAGDKVALKKAQEEAVVELAALERKISEIPPSFQRFANDLIAQVDAAKKQVGKSSPDLASYS